MQLRRLSAAIRNGDADEEVFRSRLGVLHEHIEVAIVIERPGFRFFFPITTMLLISALISLAAWVLRR